MEALRYPAAQLFMERAAASGYGAALSDIDAPIVARTCRRLDGVAVAEQGGVIAQAAKHPAGTVWAEWWLGIAHHFLGNQAQAQHHLERGMELAVEVGTFNGNFPGFDPRIFALNGLARTLWLRGFSDQALRIMQKAIDEAASRDQPLPICVSLVYASTFLLWTGSLPRAGDIIEQLIAYAGRYSLEPYRAAGTTVQCPTPELHRRVGASR